MTIWLHRTMLVPPAYATLARNLASGLDPVAGGGMFTTPVYDNTTSALRYYISCGLIGDQFAAVLASPNALFAACKGAVTLATCQALLAACVVSDGSYTLEGVTVAEDVHGLLARLNLKLTEAIL